MWLLILLLVFSISIDSFFAGLAYGGNNVQIPQFSKIIICSLSVIYTFAAMYAGKFIAGFLPEYTGKFIGCMILLILGIYSIVISILKALTEEKASENKWTQNTKSRSIGSVNLGEKELFKYIIKKPRITIKVIKNPDAGDIDQSGKISSVEAFLLGLALSVDSISTGIGSGIAGIISPLIPLGTGIFQYIFIWCGEILGFKLFVKIKKRRLLFVFVPGLTLIILSFIRLI